jgi:hypothetical protein
MAIMSGKPRRPYGMGNSTTAKASKPPAVNKSDMPPSSPTSTKPVFPTLPEQAAARATTAVTSRTTGRGFKNGGYVKPKGK